MADPSVIERPPERGRVRESIVCEFCECTLSLRGRVLKRSDKAKEIIDLDDESDRLRKQVETLTAELVEAKKKPELLSAPTPAASTKKAWQNIGDEEE